MQVSESSSEEVHPQNHMSVFTESRNWVSVGALHLHHLFYLRGSALRKINFILLCNLPLSYAYLLNKLYLLLWRPVHYENSFYLFLLYILGRMRGNWGASNLAPSASLGGKRLWVRAKGPKRLLPCYQPPFTFQHTPFFYPATVLTTGMIFVPSTHKGKKRHLH